MSPNSRVFPCESFAPSHVTTPTASGCSNRDSTVSFSSAWSYCAWLACMNAVSQPFAVPSRFRPVYHERYVEPMSTVYG